MSQTLVVGIPRYLGYYSFGPLWERFLSELGVRVVISPESNRRILDDGVREAVTDACIPIKLYHGHVLALKDRVDFVFVPRLVSADGTSTFCPKFLGLPDMIRHSLPNLPPLLAPRLQVGKRVRHLKHFVYGVGRELSARPAQIRRAYYRAAAALTDHRRRLVTEGLKYVGLVPPAVTRVRLGVVGYPYMLYDNLSNGGLVSRLLGLGALVITPEMIDPADLERERRTLPQNLFWYYSNRALWAASHLLRRPDIDGIIHISAFGCGPDAMVDKLVELECKERGRPFMSVIMDEHTGDAGLQTRAEAFVDMLVRKAVRP